MIGRQEALRIARDYVNSLPPPLDDAYVLNEQAAVEREFGWIFSFSNRKYVESQNLLALLPGLAPFIVDRTDGSVFQTGTDRPLDYYLGRYDEGRARKLHGASDA